MVKKETLLLLAGLVWGAAGFNILRIGLLAYPGHVTLWNLALSALVFGLFQGMVFGKLVQRHTARILGYGTERKWFWQFFDGKSSAFGPADWRRRASSPCSIPAWGPPC